MRSKPLALAAVALAGILALISATQPWVTLMLVEGAAAAGTLVVSGQDLNPSLSPVSIAVLAAALALTIAGRVFRRVLGVLIVALGAGIVALALGVSADPITAASSKIAEITAISGDAQLDLIASSTISPWPTVTVIAGAVVSLLGVLVVVVSGRWRAAGRKYESGSGAERAPRQEAAPDRISDWERLSGGEDPSDTEQPGDLGARG